MVDSETNILVIGAGVTGLQTARDLAERGYNVYLVEKEPNLGGKIMQLDETFPVNAVSQSCSLCYPLCYMLPELSHLYLQKNIHIFTYSEIDSIKRKKKVFEISILEKTRYVDPIKCNGCGLCVEACPVKDISDEFNFNISNRTAIYQPLRGSITPQHIIDANSCLHFKDNSCDKCSKICPQNAIDYNLTDKNTKISVQGIVIATGFDQIDPIILPQYGFQYSNVITSLQFERYNSINGPTKGQIIRPSDKQTPRNIAFVQCVGSRNNGTEGCVSYCSTVCCMYSSKEALNVRRKKLPNCECYIFNTEKRCYGKQYNDMMIDAEKQWGVNYINGRIASITEKPKTNNLILKYEDISTGKFIIQEFDLVVLAAGLKKTKGKERLAQLCGSELDRDGLFTEKELRKLEKNNIYVAGFARFPMNIPDSVTDGSAVAAKISMNLPINIKSWEPEEIDEEEKITIDTSIPKIGVFYCEFKDQISNILDFKAIKKEIAKDNEVIYQSVIKNAYTPKSQKKIQQQIKNNNLNRIIFTSGSPRYYEEYFKSLVEKVEFNTGLIDVVDLREHLTYIHNNDKKAANAKAVNLINLSLAKIKSVKPLEKVKSKITQKIAVIGSDSSSIIAANSIAAQNIEVILIHNEKTQFKRNINSTSHSTQIDEKEYQKIVKNYKKNKFISCYEDYRIEKIDGFSGNFTIILKSQAEDRAVKLNVGAIILAGGTIQKSPAYGQFKYGLNPSVMTQQEFELNVSEKKIGKISKAIIVLCANQRIDPNSKTFADLKQKFGDSISITPNCSNVCCNKAFQNIEQIKKINKNAQIFVLYRDLQLTGGILEKIYRNSKEDVIFLRYNAQNQIETKELHDGKTELGNRIYVSFNEVNTNSKIGIDGDVLILATPIDLTESTQDLSKKLKLRREKYGFLQEEHSKMLPFNSTREGIFLCGSSQWPNNIDLEISQALSASMKAINYIYNGFYESLEQIAQINTELCIGCGTCIKLCPYKAVTFNITKKHYVFGDRSIRKAEVNPLLCQSCGICVSECPVNAITIENGNDGTYLKMIEQLSEKNVEEI